MLMLMGSIIICIKILPLNPVLLNVFEPWYPLLWTDGSIGAISTGDITEDDVAKFYLGDRSASIGEIKLL